MANKKYINFITPIGTARFPHIEEPDTKGVPGKKPDNKYKVNLVLSEADTAAFKKQALAAAKELCPGVTNPKIPLSKGKKDNVVSFIFKSHKKPVVVDGKRVRVPEGVKIGGGSRIRVSGSFAGYDGAFGDGVTAYLDAVQVIELKERFDAAAAFDAVEDGFDATTVAPEAAFGEVAASSGDVLDL